MQTLILYIAASFKHLHGVRLLGKELRRMGCEILDWTSKASPPPGLTPAQRRIWMDTDQDGGQVYEFCKSACQNADLLIYFGQSGQDAGVEVGLAVANNVPVLGIRGPLEGPGLMLHGAVTMWVDTAEEALEAVHALASGEFGAAPQGTDRLREAWERRKAMALRKRFNQRFRKYLPGC